MGFVKRTPTDAIVALRSFERRYREVFAGLEEQEDESPDDLARRHVDGWSAIEHVVAAARTIAACHQGLMLLLTRDQPVLEPRQVDPAALPQPRDPAGPVEERIAELGIESASLAERVQAVPAGEWRRAGVVADGSWRRVTAADPVDAAVDAGVDHLKAARRTLDAARTVR